MANYSEKLKDPRWQKKRLEILQRDNWTCRYCEAKDKPLHVHHKYYEKDKDPWEYPDNCFITFCEDCHENEQSNKFEDESNLIKLFYEMGFSQAHFRGMNLRKDFVTNMPLTMEKIKKQIIGYIENIK